MVSVIAFELKLNQDNYDDYRYSISPFGISKTNSDGAFDLMLYKIH